MSFGDLELHGHSSIFFLIGVNGRGPMTSSTTNHEFYRALGRLHGPWCKRSLRFVGERSNVILCEAHTFFFCGVVGADAR